VLARWLGFAALAVAVVCSTAGCGSVASSNVAEATGGELAVYSSLPLQGPQAGISAQIVDGEKLALADAGGRAGPFKIGYVSLDDASPQSGRWNPDVTLANAKKAAQDTSTIAYLGDFDSAATAISLPLINAAGIVQVSPASPYQGLVSSRDAGQDEPERFYPSGHRTFARLQPGDAVQAAAQVRLMKQLGVRRVYVLDDQDPFDVPLAQIVAADAQAAGIDVLAHDSVATVAGSTFTGEVEQVAASKAQAVFLAGGQGAGTAALWRQLHAAVPRVPLLGSSAMVTPSFTAQIGAAGADTYLTTPVLGAALYPPAARVVLAACRRTFGVRAGPWALYGYEAMTLVLDAIADAGARGDDRQSVIDRVLATRDRSSAIGAYSILPDGETTLSPYGVDRVVRGRAVFDRAIDVGAGAP
jgi:branched-chain amino acid transport system substrate-binding protein